MTAPHIAASPGPRVAGNPVVLKVRGVSTQFSSNRGAVTAVNDVSFDLRRLERLGVVGESGSGKSALARSLLWLIDPPGKIVSGSVELDGRELSTLDERQWQRVRGSEIAMVVQDPMTGFDPLRTIGDQIVEAIRVHRGLNKVVARREALDLLRDVEIPFADKRLDYYPHEFSGGMRQRAMIAMALANTPKILIADEPTTALDTTTQATILRLMRKLTDQRGAAMILISHDLGVVAQVCDTVQVMYAGRIVERGPAAEVLTNPRHRYTEALLESIVRRDQLKHGRLAAIPGAPPDLRALPPGCAFEPRCAVGHGRAECVSTIPGPTSFTSEHGSVTVKCHFPAVLERARAELVQLPGANESAANATVEKTVLRVEDLVKRYAGGRRESATVLHGVSFEIQRGETLGLVGESGSGKSTTGRCIVRLTDPTSGRLMFNGVDLATLNGSALRSQRRDLQMVFQDPASSLDSRMTILQAVEEPLHIHRIGDPGSRRTRALDMLGRVGLAERHSDSKPHALSGGQRQRAAIARAIVTTPKLVILDEPVSALDVSVRAQVLNLLKELQRDLGLSYLFIVHDLAIAEYFSDRVVVLYGGRIMETGTARELFAAPAHPYTNALMSAIPSTDPRVVVDDALPIAPDPTIEAAPTSVGCVYADRCLRRTGRSLCVEQAPPLVQISAAHWSACHFSNDPRQPVERKAEPPIVSTGGQPVIKDFEEIR